MRKWWQLPEGWLSLILLILLVLIVAQSLQEARWVSSLRSALGILTPAALVGALAGFLLTRLQRIPRWIAHPLGLAGGVAWTIQLSGSLRAVRTPVTGQTVEYLSPYLQGWKDLAADLLIRSIILGRTFLRGDVGEDIVLFIIVLALVCWTLGFLSAWLAFRSHWPWAAIALPAAVLLLNMVYGPRVPPRFFHYFAFLCLVFLIYYLWKQQEQRWHREEVKYPAELPRGVLWAGIGLSAVLVIGTALLPTTAGSVESATFWDRFLQPWREVRGTWERLFSDVGSEGEGRLGGYGPSFELGGARVTPEGIALELRTSRNDYLRGITFDQYDGRGWVNTAENGLTWMLPAHQVLNPSVLKRVRVEHTVIPYLQGGNMVFAIAEPMSMTMPVVVELGTPQEVAGFSDIVSLHTRTSLQEGRPYRVVSWLSIADKQSMRRTTLNYPAWVQERYLQLPESLPQRIQELADRIVATKLIEDDPNIRMFVTLHTRTGIEETQIFRGEGDNARLLATIQKRDNEIISVSPSGRLVRDGLVNPYDAAEAIQDYLRTELTYRESIPTPPPDRDALDFFLFESQVGYCDYFATAMAVMVRSQGLAARLVRGYAAGEYNRETSSYIVPVAAAHTWLEIYFDPYGWQRFEPTPADYTSLPSRPERPPGASGTPMRTPIAELEPGDEFNPEDRIEDVNIPEGGEVDLGGGGALATITRPALLIPSLLVLLILGIVAILALRAGRGLRRLSLAAATYERMCRWAGLVGLAPKWQPTPYEYAWHLSEAIPDQRPDIALIATQYVRERFGRVQLRASELIDIHQAWNRLRWPLWGYTLQRLRREKSPQVEEAVE